MRWEGSAIDADSATLLLVGLEQGGIHVEGDALWLSGDGSDKAHMGEVEGEAVDEGGTLHYSEDDCSFSALVSHKGLSVQGGSECGGVTSEPSKAVKYLNSTKHSG